MYYSITEILEDDLFETRSNYNHLKTTSLRKRDREFYSAVMLASALVIVVIALRFRKRGEAHAYSMSKLFAVGLDERGRIIINGFNITADPGSGNDDFVEFLYELGMSSNF